MDFPCRLFILERRKGEIKRWVITHHQSENFLPENLSMNSLLDYFIGNHLQANPNPLHSFCKNLTKKNYERSLE